MRFISLLLLILALEWASADQPNIILVLTDDQDIVLRGMEPMKIVQNVVANLGVTFTNAFTSTPICCPSRASILTGKYAHNHQTFNNSVTGGCFGNYWINKEEKHMFPVLLQQHGYRTFFAGKYLNEYYSERVPKGFDSWYGLHGNSIYYNYTLNENGRLKHYQNIYLTDLLKNHTIEFLSRQVDNVPFFIMVSVPAPHSPSTPAERHESEFKNVNVLKTKNFNIPSGPLDKHWLLTMKPAVLPENIVDSLDLIYRKRWQSLLAVDELVGDINTKLTQMSLDKNTYIVFTSDNGYHMGQFSQAYDKRQLYETDIRIPLLIRGPQIAAKSLSNYPSALIDLAPTFLDWAGIPIPDNFDGRSLMPAILNKTIGRISERKILIEYWGEGSKDTFNPECKWKSDDRLNQCTLDAACHCQDSWNNTYSCIRHIASYTNFVFCEFKDHESFVEAYDLTDDPYQMDNLGFDMLPSVHAMYSLILSNLTRCSGKSCNV